MFNCHPDLLLHVVFWHKIGCPSARSVFSQSQLTSVYLNCCSTSLIVVLHVSQVKVPETNSGLTSLVRVTVPEIDIN